LPEREVSSQNSFLPAAEGGKRELLNRPVRRGSSVDSLYMQC